MSSAITFLIDGYNNLGYGDFQTNPPTTNLGQIMGSFLQSNETVFCRFTREPLVIVEFNGCVAVVRDSAGVISARAVGELTRAA